MKAKTRDAHGLVLRANLHVTDASMDASYEIENTTTKTWLVIDRMPATLSSPQGSPVKFDEDWHYVHLDERRSTASLARRVPPLEFFASEPRIALGRELAPGATLRGRFRVPLPCVENAKWTTWEGYGKHQFTGKRGHVANAPMTMKRVALELDCAPPREGPLNVLHTPHRLPEGAKLWPFDGHWRLPRRPPLHQLRATFDLPSAIPCRGLPRSPG